jgi:tryptophan synthase alpha chain
VATKTLGADSAIARAFDRAKAHGRVAFIPYVMAGDPDLETTELVLDALTAAGADLIELGVPYSDPLADGPTIAAAGARALRNQTGLGRVIEVLRRRAGDWAPPLLFSYFNPIDRYGIERFARDLAEAGGSGAIVPDCALEESQDLRDALDRHGLAMPLLVAPSTRPQRAARVVAASTGFVYAVSRLGVTGAANAPSIEPLRTQLAMLRQLTGLPLAVGFGLSDPAGIARIAPFADAVVVGSAIVDAYVGKRGTDAANAVRAFVEPLMRSTVLR